MTRIAAVISVGLVALAATPAAWAESDRAAARDFGRAARELYAAAGAQLQAWQEAGYPVKGAPKIDDPALGTLSTRTDSLGKKVERAAERLRALGVSKRTARLFTGDTDVLYKGWDLDNEVAIGDATG